MWRIIKAEFGGQWLSAIGTAAVFCFLALYMFTDTGKSNAHGELWRFVNFCIMGVMLPAMFIRMGIQKQEFTENRIRLMMLLPCTVKDVSNARIGVYLLLVALVSPIWGYILGRFHLYQGFPLIWLVISLASFILMIAFTSNMASEIQYFERVSKAKTLFWFYCFGLIPIGFLVGLIWKPIRHYYSLLGYALLTPWGALICAAIALWLGMVNRNAFMKRVTYFEAHKPEFSIFDIFRSLKGEHQYRNQK